MTAPMPALTSAGAQATNRMPQPPSIPAAVPSPCINVCRMQADGDMCIGCLRTLDEIVAWADAGEQEKRAILALVAQRRAAGGAP
jgi:predicted Fe-S protein YdhL (DUF1289 family)